MRTSRPSGFSLLEVMIALGVLLIGMLATWNLHVIGITSTAAGQHHTAAVAIGRELISGLERLPFDDPRLAESGVVGPTSPEPFGQLVQTWVNGALDLTGVHEWDDANPVPGVRSNGVELAESGDAADFHRRWTVWKYAPSPGAASGVKLVAVSVTWRERPFQRLREVVLYTQLFDPSVLGANYGANL